MISPELIISRLVCPHLQDTESVLILGAERFSDYSGYAASFAYAGPHRDAAVEVPAEGGGTRLATAVIAYDALQFGWNKAAQFAPGKVFRELNKALCAFLPQNAFKNMARNCGGIGFQDETPAVATGNWGCGAFGGDLILKAIVQFMAAAQARMHVFMCVCVNVLCI